VPRVVAALVPLAAEGVALLGLEELLSDALGADPYERARHVAVAKTVAEECVDLAWICCVGGILSIAGQGLHSVV
jgi:hypothetical protein